MFLCSFFVKIKMSIFNNNNKLKFLSLYGFKLFKKSNSKKKYFFNAFTNFFSKFGMIITQMVIYWILMHTNFQKNILCKEIKFKSGLNTIYFFCIKIYLL